jgi:hypothetical protein
MHCHSLRGAKSGTPEFPIAGRAAARTLDFNLHHYGVSALEIYRTARPALHADNVEVIVTRLDFEHRIFVIHLTSNSAASMPYLRGIAQRKI